MITTATGTLSTTRRPNSKSGNASFSVVFVFNFGDETRIVQNDPTRDCDGQPIDVNMARLHAKRHGFTHVRIVGDWTKRTKPTGGAL